MENKTNKRPKNDILDKGGGGNKKFDWDKIIDLVIDDCIDRQGIAPEQRPYIKSSFKRLKRFFDENGIDNPQKITSKTAYDYSVALARSNYISATRSEHLRFYRILVKYLYTNKYLKKNFEKTIPKVKYEGRRKNSKIWTDEELDKLIETIRENQSNIEVGTRDIAILTLLREYGLRISDVSNLKLENLDWKNRKISLIQQKTKVALELPLTDRVKKALNDYIDNGRHPSKLSHVFLSTKHDKPIERGDYFGRLKMYSEMANIDFDEKLHHGAHSIRHTLATKLLKNETPLPMIAAILGHESISPTSLYIEIDIEQLRECCLSLEVLQDGRDTV